MRIAIIYSQPIAGRRDSEDILDEVALIENSLDQLKYAHETFPINSKESFVENNPGGLIYRLKQYRPDAVFNMVEEGGATPGVSGGSAPCVNGGSADRRIGRATPCVNGGSAPCVSGGNGNEFVHAIPGLLKDAGFAFTGCPQEAMRLTTDKCLSKQILKSHGIPTPPWALSTRPPVRQAGGATPCVNGGSAHDINGGGFFIYREPLDLPPTPVIIKPAWEDASVGIDGDSVIYDIRRIPEKLIELHGRFEGQPMLIESFIDGREINMSVLQRSDGSVDVFPVVEMLFCDWPDDKPRIVDYTAKWDTDSFEFNNTIRKFDPRDVPTRELKETALKCWSAFKLRGYARVDMRLAADSGIYVIEVNANPCIAKDSGFIAAAHEAGFSTVDVIEEILKVAQNR